MVNGRGSARVTPDIAEIALGRVGTFEALSVDSEGVGVEGNVFERDWGTHSVTSGDKQHCKCADVSCSPLSGMETGRSGKEEACRCDKSSGRPLSRMETGSFGGEERRTYSDDKEACRSGNEADTSGSRQPGGEESGNFGGEEKRTFS